MTFSSSSSSPPTNTTESPKQIPPNPRLRFHLFTAYSDNYKVGDLCASVNKRYAELHGYEWTQVVLTEKEMMDVVGERGHTTWYKVHVLLGMLKERLGCLKGVGDESKSEESKSDENGSGDVEMSISSSTSSNIETHDDIEYLVWLDADATVVNFEQTMEEIVSIAGYRDLIMGEDMHSGANLINCGFFCVKVGRYSQEMWDEIWNLEISFRAADKPKGYINRPNYEQSALNRVLKRRKVFGEFFECKSRVGRREREKLNKGMVEGSAGKEGVDVDKVNGGVDPSENTGPTNAGTKTDQPSATASTLQPLHPSLLARTSSLTPVALNTLPTIKTSEEFVATSPLTGHDRKPAWHTFVYPPTHYLHWAVKVFDHVTIYPMHAVNSNIRDCDLEMLEGDSGNIPKGSSHHCHNGKRHHQRAGFLFHPAGWFRQKDRLIRGMMERRGVAGLVEIDGEGEEVEDVGDVGANEKNE